MNHHLRQMEDFASQHLWPIRRNRLLYLVRRLTHHWRLVHQTTSSITGPITVWELGRERRIVFGEHTGGTTQSIIFTRGSWAQLGREYWGHALRPPALVPPDSRILILGLGGGTMVHLAHQLLTPKDITVVELDPVVIEVARRFMGLDQLPNVHYCAGDAYEVLDELTDSNRFDLVIEDIFYAGFPGKGEDHVRAHLDRLTRVLSPAGSIVLNRWFAYWNGTPQDSGQDLLEELLNERGCVVSRKKIKQRWFNELIFASRTRQPDA